jgi:hypothetical protein
LRIDGTSRPTGTRSASGRATSSSAIFSPDTGAGAARAESVASASPATGIDALIALQSVEDPTLAKKKAVRRGRSLLDVLDAIKADLLVGRIGEGRLNQLMALIGQARQRLEPGLDGLLDDIELRARVELAKFGKFPNP